MTTFSCSDWKLTGRTRYAMKGILWWKKPALQVEFSAEVTAMETVTFSSMTTQSTRWRFATEADKMNLKELGYGEPAI